MSLRDMYVKKHKSCKIKVGDFVVITDKAKDGELGWRSHWHSLGDECINKVGKVTEDRFAEGFVVEVANVGVFTRSPIICFPFFVLRKAMRKESKEAMKLLRKEKKVKVEVDTHRPSRGDYMHGADFFRVGDTVTILRDGEDNERGWMNNWIGEMRRNVGQVGVVTSTDEGCGVGVEIVGEIWHYPHFVLCLVSRTGVIEATRTPQEVTYG